MSRRVDVDPALLLYSFRYALGRQTYAVGDVCDALMEHRAQLQPDWRRQIIEGIREAIDKNMAGAECDVQRWRECADRLEAMNT